MPALLKVIDPTSKESAERYLLRVPGWTEEQYLTDAPESKLVEFEDGEIIMHSPASITHQQILGFVTFLARGFSRTRRLGEIFNGPAVIRLRPGLDYEPDLFFVSNEQLPALTNEYLFGAPAFVVEVVSLSTRNHDLKHKAENYSRYGVKEYWAIDAEQQFLRVHLLERDHAYATSDHTSGQVKSIAIAGFWIDVSWLWQTHLPNELDCLNTILR